MKWNLREKFHARVQFRSSLYICKCLSNDCQTVRSDEVVCGVFLEIRASRSLEPKRVSRQPCGRSAKTRRRPRRVVNWEDGLEPRAVGRTVAWIEREWLWRVHVTRSHFSFVVGINSYTRKGIQPRLSFFPSFCLPWRSVAHSQHVHQARGTRRTWSRL